MSSGAAWVVWTPPLGRADVPAPGVRPNTDWASVSPFYAARGHRRARVYCFWVLFRHQNAHFAAPEPNRRYTKVALCPPDMGGPPV